MVWKIFARLPRESENFEDFAAACYSAGVIAVGWNELGNLNTFASRRELYKEFKRQYPGEKRDAISQKVGALWKFRTDVKPGHYVICPDSNSARYYIGTVVSDRVFFDDSSLDGCSFGHRRRIRWLDRVLTADEVKRIWPSGHFGGNQSVARINAGANRFLRFLRRKRRVFPGRPRLPSNPDREWGREAEARALAWLREKKLSPENIAHLNRGWDISCGDDKYEIKGRKSARSAIRLTHNEWLAAKKFKKRYKMLIFTAPTKEKLKQAVPVKIVNPTITEPWRRRIVYEYVWVEDGTGFPHNNG